MRHITILIFLIACTQKSFSQTQIPSQASAVNKTNLSHLENIQTNLLPFYSITGKTEKHSILEMMSKNNIPGIRMVFADKGKIVWSANFGYAEISKKIKVDSETVFAGASLSKPITSVIALQLCDEGKLRLDENINNWLSGWKIPGNDITQGKIISLRFLLSHTAGLDRKNWSEYSPTDSIPSLIQMLKGEKPSVDKRFSFINEPGKAFKYSNTGYLITQKAIEDVTGEPFAKVAEAHIFKPLRMNHTSFKQPIAPVLLPYKATGYSSNLKPFSYKIYPFEAAGGIWTTPDDLAKFTITLIND